MKWTFIFVSLLLLGGGASCTKRSSHKSPSTDIPDHITNVHYDQSLTPRMDETAPQTHWSQASWRQYVAETKKNVCQETEAEKWWVSSSDSKIELLTIKNENVEVPATFDRFLFLVKQTSTNDRVVKGWVDLTSFNSRLPARDYRVMKYALGVESQKKPLAEINFVMSGNESTKSLTMTFWGQEISLGDWSIKWQNQQLVMNDYQKVKFLSSENVGRFETLMKLCQHKSLASFVKVKAHLKFQRLCSAKK